MDRGETAAKVVVTYVSMWGATERLVRRAAEALLLEGVLVAVHDLSDLDVAALAGDLVDARGIVLGSPTVLGGLHPRRSTPSTSSAPSGPLRYAAVLSPYGWGGGALRQVAEVLGPTGIEIVGTVEVHGAPGPEDDARAASVAHDLAAKLREERKLP